MTVQYSVQKMVSDGTLSTFVLGIQYLQRNDVYLRIAGEETPQSGALSGYTWSFVDNTTIKITPVVPNGVEVVVYRRTDIDAMYNIYSQNAQFDEATIDENNEQLLFIAQEYLEQGIPGAGVESLEYINTVLGINYYRFRLTDGSVTPPFGVPDGTDVLRNDLLGVAGVSLIGSASYADVRAYTGAATKVSVYGRTNIFDRASGVFAVDTSDTTSTDNAGTILVDVLGRRWKRLFSGAAMATWFGAATGANSAAAIQNAVNSHQVVYVEGHESDSYLIESKVSVPTGRTLKGCGEKTRLSKVFNGDAFDSGELSLLKDFVLLGNGQTYTGRGVIITTGANAPDRGRQVLDNVRILDTQSYCVDYVNDGAPAIGYRSVLKHCDFRVYNNTVPAVRWPDEPTTGGNRKIIDCDAASGPLLDTGGCDNGTVSECVAGANIASAIPSVIFRAGAKKITFTGNRLASGGINTDIKGENHTFAGNIVAGPVSVNTAAKGIRFDSSNVVDGQVTNNSTSKDCFVDIGSSNYVPGWFGTVTNPVIGNGSLIGRYSVTGRRVTVEILASMGPTTTFGSGIWSFSAPFAASNSPQGNPVEYVGSCYALNSGVNFQVGAAFLGPGSSSIKLVFGGASNLAGNTNPFVWKNGDYMRLSISYSI